MNKFLQIKEWTNGDSKYFYAERLGVDSVAFILHDTKTGLFGLIREFKPPINDYLVTAFGGSIDKDLEQMEIVREEVREEAGYIDVHISYAGRAFVSTQMNQFCYLYLVDVTYATKIKPEPQNAIEALAEVKWLHANEIVSGDDWKAITILKKMGLK